MVRLKDSCGARVDGLINQLKTIQPKPLTFTLQ